ncbi:MAG: FAD:protein FMN transferase [Lachnospiraceae bacterium]|nr:FAD:protein FMN transferase [Lachnospiraceae bacterium]
MKFRSRDGKNIFSDQYKTPLSERKRLLIGILLFLLFLFAIIFRQPDRGGGADTSSDTEITVYKTGYCFDTVITLTAYTSQGESGRAAQILEDALLLCQEYEATYLDRFDEESEVGAINAAQRQESDAGASGAEEDEASDDRVDDANGNTGNAGHSYELSEVCRDLVEIGLYYYHVSDGAFDLTITPLSDLWNVTDEDFTVPAAEQVAEAKALVGSDSVTLSGNVLTIGAGQQLNFGGIAKGYMCETLRQYFIEKGLLHVIVNLGGNVFVMGGGDGYTVAVANPLSGDYAATVVLSDGYVVTSGIYERGQEADGVWYHHIINPSTGYPADTEIVSATVVMDTAVDQDSDVAWHSDALSTMFVLAKTQKGADVLWQRLKEKEDYDVLSQVILVMEDGTVVTFQ